MEISWRCGAMGKYSSTAGKVEWHRRLQNLLGVLETHIYTHRCPLYEAHERRAIRPTDYYYSLSQTQFREEKLKTAEEVAGAKR